ncbi:MAG: endonuclease MutS2 [Christensenellaceae bacterium]|jgi:DNA mismatch repair protein MutS2|nr:endonuclease MutS2 [Christensenellaceae bacterium]
MEAKSLYALEFNKILNAVAFYAHSLSGKEKTLELAIQTDLSDINNLLTEVAESVKCQSEYSTNPNFSFDDITPIIKKAEIMSVLNMSELLKIASFFRSALNIKASILKILSDDILLLKNIAKCICLDPSIEKEIRSAIISESEMSDDASPTLRTIRMKIRKESEKIKVKLDSYINTTTYSKYIQDNIVTIRADRFVIPVKAEFKGMIPGLIHDQSSSGQTYYVEPMPIVEMNNVLKLYRLEEEEEIERILREFTIQIRRNSPDIELAFMNAVRLDGIFAKAKYAISTNAIMPRINNKGIINIYRGRHPLISSDRVIPININLGKTFNMLFITGPNTGGKTVSLKLVGLFTLMAMAGLFVPAGEAELSIFDNIFCDIGDEQSIEQNLSTFSSHIANIVGIIDNVSNLSLVLLDELGGGTDPSEGAALAISISKYLKDVGCRSIITTHYNELKEFAIVTDGIENASMDFNPITYNPTYKLIIGTAGVSNAILIAKKLGLKEKIINNAKSQIDKGSTELKNVLSALDALRSKALENEELTSQRLREVDDELKKVNEEKRKLFLQRETINSNVHRETKRLVDIAMYDANEIINTLKALLEDPSEKNLFKARTLKKSLNKFVSNDDNEYDSFENLNDGDISITDSVLIKPLNVTGIVIATNVDKNTASVRMGKLQSNFKLSELIKVKSQTDTTKKDTLQIGHTFRNESFSPEINLIGKTSIEAESELDSYIDNAILSGVNEIKIIHGYGSGRLREAVQHFLKGHYAIKSIRSGTYHEGYAAVTIATLKR